MHPFPRRPAGLGDDMPARAGGPDAERFRRGPDRARDHGAVDHQRQRSRIDALQAAGQRMAARESRCPPLDNRGQHDVVEQVEHQCGRHDGPGRRRQARQPLRIDGDLAAPQPRSLGEPGVPPAPPAPPA